MTNYKRQGEPELLVAYGISIEYERDDEYQKILKNNCRWGPVI